MVLVTLDFALEPKRLLPPNVKFIGPLGPRMTQPLPREFQDFVDGADLGMLLVSTGTIMTTGAQQHQAMAKAFSSLPLRVLWKLSAQEANDSSVSALQLGPNVKASRAKNLDVEGVSEAAPSAQLQLTHPLSWICLPLYLVRDTMSVAASRSSCAACNWEKVISTCTCSTSVCQVIVHACLAYIADVCLTMCMTHCRD